MPFSKPKRLLLIAIPLLLLGLIELAGKMPEESAQEPVPAAGVPAPDPLSRFADARRVTAELPVVASSVRGEDVQLDPKGGFRLLLSGSSPDDGVQWDFLPEVFATSAALAEESVWSRITVPKNWEFEVYQGLHLGSYSYGRGEDRSDPERKSRLADQGTYRHRFVVPSDLANAGQRYELLFDGVMTDTKVFLNGKALITTTGQEVHQGAFVPFAYDVTDHLLLDGENELVVAVREESSNESVNRAERDADYWIFGGIFRPVWLRALPERIVDQVAVDAEADGRLRVEVRADLDQGAPTSEVVFLRLSRRPTTDLDEDSEKSGAAEVAESMETIPSIILESQAELKIASDNRDASRSTRGLATFDLMVPDIEPWSAHNPVLYDLELWRDQHPGPKVDGDSEADNNTNTVLTSRVTRVAIGFRTLEVRRGPSMSEDPWSSTGLFLNGERLVLRGINRHSFWPSTGRALSTERNRADVELIKSLGFNAVRSSHYPPDNAFLDACDELGLYVIDEFPGWHESYDTDVGSSILRAMLERDHNHPSILFWANGNEGGWNPELEPMFGELDLQKRPVLRPDALHNDFDSRHYPDWPELEILLNPTGIRYRYFRPLQPPPLLLFTEMLHGLYEGGGAASLKEYWQALSSSPRFAGGFLWDLLDEGVVRVDYPILNEVTGKTELPYDTAGSYAPDGILGPFREPSASSRAIRRLFGSVPNSSPYSKVAASAGSMDDDRDSGDSDLLTPLRPARTEPGATSLTTTETTVTLSAPDVVIALARDGRGLLNLHTQQTNLPISGGQWRTSATMPEDRQKGQAPRPQLVFEHFASHDEATDSGESFPEWWQKPSALRRNAARITQIFDQPAYGVSWTLQSSTLTVDIQAPIPADLAWAGFQFDFSPSDLEAFEWQGLGPDRVFRNRWSGDQGVWRTQVPKVSPKQLASVFSLSNEQQYDYLDVRGPVRLDQGRLLISTVEDLDDLFPLGLKRLSPGGTLGLFAPHSPPEIRTIIPSLPEGLTVYLLTPGLGTKFSPAERLLPKRTAEVGRATFQFLFAQ